MTPPSPNSFDDTASRSSDDEGRSRVADLRQGGTIVVSILLALLLGAGWQWMVDRVDEGDYRDRLRDEFVRGHEELGFDQAAREATLSASARLLDIPAIGLPANADSLRALSAALIDFRYYTPTHPALDELIASGRLELLRSTELRHALLTYIQERDRLAVVEQRERDFVANVLEPWLVEHLPLTPAPASRDPVFWGPGVAPDDLREVAADPAFGTLMALRIDRTETALRFSRGLGLTIEAVLEELPPLR